MSTEVSYLRKTLRSPLVVEVDERCDVDTIHRLEDAGAGAVVLKPLLEEEIIWDIKLNGQEVAPVFNYGQNLKVVSERMSSDHVKRFLDHVGELKLCSKMPLVGSVDCYSFDSWISYIKRIDDAGCDAIELKVNLFPFDSTVSSDDVERLFDELVATARRVSSMPISFMLSPYFTNLTGFVQRLSWMSIDNLTLFSFAPRVDVDVNECTLKVAPQVEGLDASMLLWLSVLKNRATCALTATLPSYDADEAIKLMLAGASAVRFTLPFSDASIDGVSEVYSHLTGWMEKHGYANVGDFVGKAVPDEMGKGFQTVRAYLMQRS